MSTVIACTYETPLNQVNLSCRLTNEDRRKKLDPSHDPLHNPGSNSNGTNSRAVYLDAERRRALKEDYGVEPFTVHQFMGEALFIPAGSPRQVGGSRTTRGAGCSCKFVNDGQS